MLPQYLAAELDVPVGRRPQTVAPIRAEQEDFRKFLGRRPRTVGASSGTEQEDCRRFLLHGCKMPEQQPVQEVLAGDALLLTPKEAARLLRVGRTTIYGLIKAGELRSVHIGRSCRLAFVELERYVDRLHAPPAQPPAQRRRRGSRPTTNQSGLFDVVHNAARAE